MTLVPHGGRWSIALVLVTSALAALLLARGGSSLINMDDAPDRSSGIRKVSATEFEVPRSLVEAGLRDQYGFMGSVSIVPHEREGRLIGVKLYGMRANSAPRELGLQNGDLLRAVNGIPIVSPEAVREAYGQLRGASAISVALERRGQPLALSYAILESRW